MATSKASTGPFLLCIMFLVLLLETVTSFSFTLHQNMILQLTRSDENGIPLGRMTSAAIYTKPFRLYNRATGGGADFAAEFFFVVDAPDSHGIGDGLAFFIAPENFRTPPNSRGGYLGLVSAETALDSTKNRIVAVEFDSYGGNDWDPPALSGDNHAHVGININSIQSVETTAWMIYFKDAAGGAKAKARISYASTTQKLSVLVNYFDTDLPGNTELSHVIDLKAVLPERVVVGLSATTGDLTETHDIHTWSFAATDV